MQSKPVVFGLAATVPLLGLVLNAGCLGSVPARGATLPKGPQASLSAPVDIVRFHAFLESLRALAAAHGLDRAFFEQATRALSPDPSVARAPTRQSEFERRFSAYFSEAVGDRRVRQGRELAGKWHAELSVIAQRYGVPASMLLAAWGMESDFGRAMGGKDIIRSLATLAFVQPERPLFRDEFLDALIILQKGAVVRADMKGSWAGAMGGPQFLPSTYLAHAVSYSGSRAPNIWTNAPDILASIAAYLRASGWQRGAPWGMEARLPAHFTFTSLHADYRGWTALGVTRADGRALPARGDASLFLPEGAGGPAFLLGANYWVIKTYNNSDAYALAFACLADRIAGSQGLRAAWPKTVKLWRRPEKAEIQRLLTRLGYYKGIIDGKFGPSSRDAIHAFQLADGDQPADGIGGADLLARLRKRAGG
jgi:membrane-bound lytic murein transglycosylase B